MNRSKYPVFCRKTNALYGPPKDKPLAPTASEVVSEKATCSPFVKRVRNRSGSLCA